MLSLLKTCRRITQAGPALAGTIIVNGAAARSDKYVTVRRRCGTHFARHRRSIDSTLDGIGAALVRNKGSLFPEPR
jgi:hypothetical protein